MVSPTNLLSLALLYVCVLFAVAWYADRKVELGEAQRRPRWRGVVYALSLVGIDTRMGISYVVMAIGLFIFVLGMMVVPLGLGLLRRVRPGWDEFFHRRVHPAEIWLARWLPLFFITPLVLLPTRALPSASLLSLLLALSVALFVATFWAAGWLAAISTMNR